MKSLYDQLAKMTIIVADTGDINSIEKYKPRDATTNPSLIADAAKMPEYDSVVENALNWAKDKAGKKVSRKKIIELAIDRLAVEFGIRILNIIPGRVSSEVDARLSYDTAKTIRKARNLIDMYQDAGISRERVLVKIAATWEGVLAAETLEREGIHCNLTLLFGFHQAVAGAMVKATLISPFVGRILDWHKKKTGKDEVAPEDDPGVQAVIKIFNYYKKFEHETEIMGASFRNLDEILALAGVDLLTIAPKFLEMLKNQDDELVRKLDEKKAANMDMDKVAMSKAIFEKMHKKDKMATELLEAGIAGFSKALENLEVMLAERLVKMGS